MTLPDIAFIININVSAHCGGFVCFCRLLVATDATEFARIEVGWCIELFLFAVGLRVVTPASRSAKVFGHEPGNVSSDGWTGVADILAKAIPKNPDRDGDRGQSTEDRRQESSEDRGGRGFGPGLGRLWSPCQGFVRSFRLGDRSEGLLGVFF